MQNELTQRGLAELRAARSKSRGLYWAVGLFSLFANLLMLTGPMYMLQVYDRVLGSRSVETLIALSLLVVFLYYCCIVLFAFTFNGRLPVDAVVAPFFRVCRSKKWFSEIDGSLSFFVARRR